MIKKIEGQLKNTIELKRFSKEIKVDINYYSIVYLLDNDSEILLHNIPSLGISSIAIFTNKEQASTYADYNNRTEYRTKAAMLGTILEENKHNDCIKLISLNPEKNGEEVDDFIFIPFFDSLTKQKLISPSDEAISLLSIDQYSHRLMGAEITFFSINNKFLPEDNQQRSEKLTTVLDDISFIIPRIPMPKGSINFICLILNLENPVEEKAFIRDYELFDCYSEVLYVTSDLKLQSGSLQEISYDGSNLEGIYLPIYNRQKAKRNSVNS